MRSVEETRSGYMNAKQSNYIALARKYLDEDDEYRARQIILARRLEQAGDPEAQLAWADLCEEAGLAIQARECYLRALRAAPENEEALFNLALLNHATGHYEDAIHGFKKMLIKNPAHQIAGKMLAESYQALGWEGRARAIRPENTKPDSPLRCFPPSLGKEELDIFLNLFSGRETGYMAQRINPGSAEVEFDFINEPLTADVIARHIRGELTAAVLPLRSDKTVKHVAVEIRPVNRILFGNLKNPGGLALIREKALEQGRSLVKLAEKRGLSAYLDHGGGFSFRVWLFFKEFVHFLRVRSFINEFTAEISALDSGLVIEPLTATRGTGVGWEERFLLLPMGLDRATGKRILFLDQEGKPFEEQLVLLKKIREVPFRHACEVLREEPNRSVFTGKTRYSRNMEKLLQACPVLAEIVAKAGQGRMLSHMEKIIVFYSIGLLDTQGIELHGVLEQCPDYRYAKVERQRTRLKINPISCLKIRRFVPEITSATDCRCSFDLRGGKYPSPLLHVNPRLVTAERGFGGFSQPTLKEAAKRYIDLKRQTLELEQAMEKIGLILDEHFIREGLDRIRIGETTLVRGPGSSAGRWEIGA